MFKFWQWPFSQFVVTAVVFAVLELLLDGTAHPYDLVGWPVGTILVGLAIVNLRKQ